MILVVLLVLDELLKLPQLNILLLIGNLELAGGSTPYISKAAEAFLRDTEEFKVVPPLKDDGAHPTLLFIKLKLF